MTSKAGFFGYWLPVDDEESARDAVKMSGLPVLVMGLNFVILSLFPSPYQATSDYSSVISGVVALVLIFVAFRIRGGHAGLVPGTTSLFCVFIVLNAVLPYIGYFLAGGRDLDLFRLTISLIIPAICAALALNGWRGWRWLRKNNLPTPY
ncbi:hypothetical protein [Martelella mediterranea]|nr:hypothetical protein [Martelella mediterranea]